MNHHGAEFRRPLRITTTLENLFTTEQFTYRQIRQMFLPLLLDQLFIFSINILAMAMVASSGESALTAVTLVAPISAVITALFTSLSAGGTILVARARGSNDADYLCASIGQSILLTTLSGMLCTVIFGLFSAQILGLFYPAVEPAIRAQASEYMLLMGLSYIPYGVFNSIFGAFRGIGESKSALFLTLVINLAHFSITFLLINVFHMGIAGSGWSFIIARTLGAIVAVVWMFLVRNTMGMRLHHVVRFARKLQAAILSLSMPIAMEQILFQFSALVIQIIIARLPASSTAAFGLTNSAANLFNCVAFSLNSIIVTIVGQCLGANRSDLASHYCSSVLRVGRWLLLIATVILAPLMPLVLRLYHPASEVFPQALVAVLLIGAAMPLLWGDANIPSAAMRAAGDGSFVMLISLAAMWLGRIVAGYLLTFTLGMGVTGFSVGLVLEWLIRGLLTRPRLRSGRWLHKVHAAKQA